MITYMGHGNHRHGRQPRTDSAEEQLVEPSRNCIDALENHLSESAIPRRPFWQWPPFRRALLVVMATGSAERPNPFPTSTWRICAHWIVGGGKSSRWPVTKTFSGDGSVTASDDPGTRGLTTFGWSNSRTRAMCSFVDPGAFPENYDSNGVPTFNTSRAERCVIDRFKAARQELECHVIIQHYARVLRNLPVFLFRDSSPWHANLLGYAQQPSCSIDRLLVHNRAAKTLIRHRTGLPHKRTVREAVPW